MAVEAAQAQQHPRKKRESSAAAGQSLWWIPRRLRSLLYVSLPVISCMHATLQARAHHVATDSLRSLNLSEATVITFMMPLVASFGGYLLLGSSISWIEILLSILSLFGVVLVASPDALFSASEATLGDAAAVSSVERVWALCVGLLGVCGSAAAFLSMSAIGKTEDPLTVVNYFAAMCTVVSCVALIVLPGLGFQAPGDIWEWALLFFSGLSGFLMVGHYPDIQVSVFFCQRCTNYEYHSNSSLLCHCRQRSHSLPLTWCIPKSSSL